MATSFDLTEIKFENIGKWALVSGRLEYQIELKDRSIINFPNALYAFVVNAEDSEGGHVVYIGKTTKSLKNRFMGYTNPGKSQQTNVKVNIGIRKEIELGSTVHIFCFKSLENLSWGVHSINLAAGLEDSLVRNFKPIWNGSQGSEKFITETQEIELENEPVSSNIIDQEEILDYFDVKLQKAYYEQGFINPGVRIDSLLGKEGDTMELIIDGRKLKTKVNRTANRTGCVRLYFGRDLVEILQRRFQYADTITYGIISSNKIILLS